MLYLGQKLQKSEKCICESFYFACGRRTNLTCYKALIAGNKKWQKVHVPIRSRWPTWLPWRTILFCKHVDFVQSTIHCQSVSSCPLRGPTRLKPSFHPGPHPSPHQVPTCPHPSKKNVVTKPFGAFICALRLFLRRTKRALLTLSEALKYV